MATINDHGNIIAHCPTCDGAKSTFEYIGSRGELGHVTKVFQRDYRHYSEDQLRIRFQLFKCTACGAGALGVIKMMEVHGSYPQDIWRLLDFYPEAKERLPLPKEVPVGIQREFREAELCSEAGCYRAAAGMLRSVLDKTLRANGNQAAHGAEVSESAARWVLDTAPEVLDELDRLIESGQ